MLLNTGGQQLGVRVNDPLATGEDVVGWALSPDGTRVSYRVFPPASLGGQIFSAPSDGSQGALALTDPLPPGRMLSIMRLSPDGQRIAYKADADTQGQFELYVVPTDGSQPAVKLSGAMIPAGDVQNFTFVPDGSKLVYTADAVLDGYQFPFSVPADGSLPPVQLASSGVIGDFVLSPDGQTLVFRNTEVYSVPVDGSAPPLELSTYPGNDFTPFGLAISPDGTRVVYQAVSYPVGGAIDLLFSVPIDGSAIPVLLFDPDPESFWENPLFGFSPDSQWVVYRSLSSGPGGLYRVLRSVPIDGSFPGVTLNGGAGSAGTEFRITPDGTVIFRFEPTGGQMGLYTTHVDGSTSPFRIVGAPGDPYPVKAEITSQGQVLFVGYTGQYELFRVPLDGSSAPVRLNPPMVAGGGLALGNTIGSPSFILSADEQWITYVADQIVDERFELFALATDGSLPCRKLNAPLAPGGDVFPILAFAGTSRRVLYSADQDQDQTYELFTTVIQPGGGDGPCKRAATGTPPNPSVPVRAP